ncbi:MAG: MFS transporter [Micromonosporaceae bacterium]
MTMSTEAPTASKRAAGVLALLTAAQVLIAIDFSIVFVALPSIGAELGMSKGALQWVVSGYAVFFAGFLIVGGRATDRLGPRNMFIAALLLFGVASLLGGRAEQVGTLLVARAGQGIAAALMQPAIMALINTTFPAGKARNRALSIWGAVGATGLASGVLLGGVLTEISWRWIFLINIPMALLGVLAAPRLLPAHAAAARRRLPLNVPSAVLCTAAVLALVLGLTWAAELGWTATLTLAVLGGAGALALGFAGWERRSEHPLVDPVLRRTRSLVFGCGASALYMASVAASEFFLITLLLQQGRGYQPLAAGFAFLPFALTISAGNVLAGKLANSLGVRRTLILAFTVDAVGLLLLAAQIGGDNYFIHLLPGLLVSGIGHGMTFSTMFMAGTQHIADSNQGVGSALMTTTQYIGGALGVAVLVLVLGADPGDGRFGVAFGLTAAVAAVGAALAFFGFRARADQPV